jgi:hypothetical protein
MPLTGLSPASLSCITTLERRSFARLAVSALIGATAALSKCKTGFAEQSDADSTAIACIQAGDTACAVEAFAAEFKIKPYDDQIRESYFTALIVDALRCLDQGKLFRAKDSYETASELLPNDMRLAYLSSALANYKNNLYVDAMNLRRYLESNESELETRYVEIEGILGSTTDAFAMTVKETEKVYWQQTFDVPGDTDCAFRCLYFPLSPYGAVHFLFGGDSDGSFYDLTLDIPHEKSNGWRLDYYDSASSTWLGIGETSTLFETSSNTWHQFEVRHQGQSMTFISDYAETFDAPLLDYAPGWIGFGVELSSYSTMGSFSTAFTDVTVYSLK